MTKPSSFLGARYNQVEDDGYSKTWKGQLSSSKILRAAASLKQRLFGRAPGNLILIRHGESEWNHNGTFTGWVDVDLNERGRREIEHAARLLLERGLTVDVTYTSRLKRAIRSTWIILRELNQIYRPVFKSYRLNERQYGALEGLSKRGLADQLGSELVQSYRSGLLARPPAMDIMHPYWHKNERKYADLDPSEIPLTESLQDTMERALPLWEQRIFPAIQQGRNVMVVAHGNSLRGIVKHIDNLSADEIQKFGIPNGIPLLFRFDFNMKPVRLENAAPGISGEFLEQKGLLRKALDREAELYRQIPGYNMENTTYVQRLFDTNTNTNFDPYLRGLKRLAEERQLIDLIANNNVTAPKADSYSAMTDAKREMKKNITPVKLAFLASLKKITSRLIKKSATKLVIGSEISELQGTGAMSMLSKKSQFPLPLLVIIRHGKTEHNKLGLFTGWYDATLSPEGRLEAKEAGILLRRHQIEFDVVYTSWLSRAIETAWLVLNELDCLWLPIIKTWRLNERMYGALTSMSKKMIGQKYGEKQLKLWRRSYDKRPPRVASFSSLYPGNDDRYVKYVKDVRWSFFESFIRTIASGRLELHRKFPKTESLSDCMERTIPYLTEEIIPKSLNEGKNVLIASSENAIRGLLMSLCDIAPENIHKIEIPTGLPMIYFPEQRCIRLLDDGSGLDPFTKYNFGSSPELLFKPVQDCTSSAEGETYHNNGTIFACNPLIKLPTPERV